MTGHSFYINGGGALDHLHAIRAHVDAVVVGIGTVIADDPQLNVRRVEGRDPARVVIDPNGRLPVSARILRDDGARRLVLRRAGRGEALPRGVEEIILDGGGNGPRRPAADSETAGSGRVPPGPAGGRGAHDLGFSRGPLHRSPAHAGGAHADRPRANPGSPCPRSKPSMTPCDPRHQPIYWRGAMFCSTATCASRAMRLRPEAKEVGNEQ